MEWKRKKKALHGLVGGLGVVAFLIGVIGGLHSNSTAVVVAFSIWIIGATLVEALAA